MTHKDWEGIAFYDLIFPLFVFIVGASLVFSLSKTIAELGKTAAVKRIFWRSLLLYLIGVFTASLLAHLGLVALVLLVGYFVPPVIVKKGEPIFVELPKPEEPAPRGNPALPPGPPSRPSPPPAPKSPPAVKPAPKVETARPAPKPEPARPAPAPSKSAPEPAPTQMAKAAPAEPEGAKAAPAAPKEESKPEPSAPPAGEPKVTLSKPSIDLPPSLQGGTGGGRPGGGGGLLGGRGGVEGEPVPFDTTDPRYTDYFEKIRRRIKENWIYPREAGERGIGGHLLIEFGIRKDGWLQFVDLKRSSGVPVLDQ
jgi:outer membrane biosynthesis protein TonB